jgi:prepilin-type N-terminal cleavage/methylation domain-containing protein
MKLNNKGITLIEIMISVTLIAIVMVFLFNLLIDLRADEGLSTKKNSDLINQAGIIRLIENDFVTKGVKQISGCGSDPSYPCLGIDEQTYRFFQFTFNDNTIKYLIVYKDHLEYGLKDNNYEGWPITSTNYDLDGVKYNVSKNNPYISVKINIPTADSSSSKNKLDINLFFITTYSDYRNFKISLY